MPRFWEMYTIYKTKDFKTPMGGIEWEQLNRDLAYKPETDLTDDYMITITPGDKVRAAQSVR